MVLALLVVLLCGNGDELPVFQWQQRQKEYESLQQWLGSKVRSECQFESEEGL